MPMVNGATFFLGVSEVAHCGQCGELGRGAGVLGPHRLTIAELVADHEHPFTVTRRLHVGPVTVARWRQGQAQEILLRVWEWLTGFESPDVEVGFHSGSGSPGLAQWWWTCHDCGDAQGGLCEGPARSFAAAHRC